MQVEDKITVDIDTSGPGAEIELPEEKKEDHIETLSVIAERFNNVKFCDTLRRAQNSLELYKNAIAF